MDFRNSISTVLLVAVASSIVQCCYGTGCGGCYPYGQYGLGAHLGGYGACSVYSPYQYPCAPCAPYTSCLPCLKAKLLKKYFELKKPGCCLQKCRLRHALHKPCLPFYGCCRPSASYQAATCLKYPSCGPCPYSSFQPKCLKHKATLALCS